MSIAPAIPSGWQVEPLSQVADIQGGIQKQPKRRPVENRYPFLRVANVTRGALDLEDVHEVELFGTEIDKYRLEPGDLLVVEGNGSASQIGRSAVWSGEIEDCVHQNHLIRVRPRASVYPKYLEHYWNAPSTAELLASLASSTSGLFTLSVAKLKSVPVVFPAADEQEQIVEILDEQLSRLDAAIASIKTARAKANQMRSSILHAGFTGGLMRSASAARPGGWEQVTIAEVASFVRGVTYKRPQASEEPGDGFIPLLRATNIADGELVLSDFVYVPTTLVKEDQKLQPDDVVIATSSGSIKVVGKAAPVRGSFAGTFGAFCGALRPGKALHPGFLHLFASSPSVRAEWSDAARGTNINNLKPAQVLKTFIPLPPRDEQELLVQILEDELSRLDSSLAAMDGAEARCTALRRSLLHAAFTGKLTEGWRKSHV